MAKSIVLTGATGLIGSALFKRLKACGNEVIVLVRNPEKARQQLPDAKKYVRWDALESEGEWQKELDGVDAVIHLAGVPVVSRWSEDYKKQIYDSRVLSTRYLVSAIAKASKKPEVFISASAIGYYGNQGYGEAVEALTEDAPAANDFLAKVCVDWEREAFAAEKLGVRTVAVRIGIVLSTKSGILEKMMTPFKLFAGGPIGSGKQWVSWIHIDDEVEVFLFALERTDVRGVLNATAPQPVMMSTFASTLGKVMSRPSFFPVPKAALQVLFGDAVDVVAEGQRVVPKRLQSLGFMFRYPNLEPALKDLIEHNK